MRKLIAFSLILTLVFAALIFGSIASQWRSLPDGVGFMVFQITHSDSQTQLFTHFDIDALHETSFMTGDRVTVLINPLAAFQETSFGFINCALDGQSLLIAYQMLFRLNVKTGVIQQLTSDPHEIAALAWSSDQRQIAFSDVGDTNIFLLNADATPPIQSTELISNSGVKGSLAWSPDSREIAFSTYSNNTGGIGIINVATTAVRWVYTSKLSVFEVGWSPDGQRLAFIMNANSNNAIYTIQPDGTNLTRLTEANSDSFDPRWSPDGSLISYSSPGANGHYQLYVMNADGSDQHLVFAAPLGQDAFNLCWLPPQKETS